MDNIIEDFSFPLAPFSKPQVGIFWDVEDYSFPEEYRDNPDLIYEKILEVVKSRGDVEASGKMSIWAYVDETDEYWKDKLVNKTWKQSIYFLPRGHKTDRRMFHDILLWAHDAPEIYHPDNYGEPCQYLMVISDQALHDEGFFNRLGVLNSSLSHFIVYIRLPLTVPDRVPWPKRVFDGVDRYFDDAYNNYVFGMDRDPSKRPKLLLEVRTDTDVELVAA